MHTLLGVTQALTSAVVSRAQALAVAWLIDHDVGTDGQRAELFELGQMLHVQGFDWVSTPQKHSLLAAAASRADLLGLSSRAEHIGVLCSQERCFDAHFSDHCEGGARHNVNVAQAIKSSGIWYRFSGDTTMRALSTERMAKLDEFFGL
eukprot:SAG31_NODE_19536_length_599_cov_1.004000_1_plen_149_part_00